MGVFLGGSAVVGRGREEVRERLEAYCTETRDDPVFEDFERFCPEDVALTQRGPNTTVLYPSSFVDCDDASKFLSKTLSTTVLSIHVHDDDLGMFIGFQNGDEVAWFNPCPDYWSENLKQSEYEKWQGDPKLVANLLGNVRANEIARYFVRWTPELLAQERRTAYEGDESCCGDWWQLVDFLRRCGFAFPDPPEEPNHVIEPTHELVETCRPIDTAKLRHDAEVAWRNRDYAAACQFLTELGDERQPSEEKKLDYCRRKPEER